jgi:hypothetical protein
MHEVLALSVHTGQFHALDICSPPSLVLPTFRTVHRITYSRGRIVRHSLRRMPCTAQLHWWSLSRTMVQEQGPDISLCCARHPLPCCAQSMDSKASLTRLRVRLCNFSAVSGRIRMFHSPSSHNHTSKCPRLASVLRSIRNLISLTGSPPCGWCQGALCTLWPSAGTLRRWLSSSQSLALCRP